MITDMFIRTVAAEVRGHDAKYEASLKERERNNPKYGFLLNKHVSISASKSSTWSSSLRQHRRHAFYRGLVEREDGIDPAFDDEVCRSQASSSQVLTPTYS